MSFNVGTTFRKILLPEGSYCKFCETNEYKICCFVCDHLEKCCRLWMKQEIKGRVGTLDCPYYSRRRWCSGVLSEWKRIKGFK